jgi:hypothetical protein
LTGEPPRLAEEAGLDRAAELVRRSPLCWAAGDSGRSIDAVLDRGWFEGADECARVLSSVAPVEIVAGAGFGGAWPMLIGAGRVLAPAMPVAVGTDVHGAIDGEYRRAGNSIWREAVGVDEPFLAMAGPQGAPGTPFDLLCFGRSERIILRAGDLEIEDLFGRLTVPGTADLLDRVLVRALRLNPEILSSLRVVGNRTQQVVEVRRASALSADERWRDAAAFLASRADVEGVRSRGGCVEIVCAGNTTASFALDEFVEGWQLTLSDGRYPLTGIHLERRSAVLGVRATLASWVDGLAPGMRGRLIFDLRSDLVALG